MPLLVSKCPPGGAAVLFSSSSSFHLYFLYAFLLTPLPPLIQFLPLSTPADFLPTEYCLCQHLAYPEAVYGCHLALISTPTGLCGSVCPDVQELMCSVFELHICVAWPSLDVPSSALGKKKNMKVVGLSRG